ncbi:PDGLE domain-containing protein [Methanospirillum hungatei]|jgi:cobalt/nickel transport protein|uniref:PDGLE domain-containing protein n=1 Tax=Methanospirillum hungatei TaxID=2203 RepID=UPI001B4B6078|nr:PDGLE domain-containing protein [Methanospirillum hungatei]MBP7035115.1 PDGLE domain-containing protein [Methanospirillum sp.]MBP9008237.1 PDGLE domain-containing protein [Methanospirillum sp.]HOW04372.1 PDGLE domain-containing protein [Methanospirillum hungatei]
MIDNKTFIIAGLLISLLIGTIAVFLASGDPDGLESTALVVSGQKELTGLSPEEGDPEVIGTGSYTYESPMPDYSLGEEMGSTGGIIAIVVGTIITMLIVMGASYAIRLSKNFE